jgi:hypothetical protein
MDLKTLLSLITTTFIVAGGIAAFLQLRHMHKQRARESALQMLHSFRTPEFLTAVDLVFALPEGLSKKEIDERVGDRITSLLVLFGTFESLGVLVYRRDIDIRLVEDFFSGVLVLSGRKLLRYLEEMRTLGGRETYYEWYQWLYEQVEKREREAPATPAFIAHREWRA